MSLPEIDLKETIRGSLWLSIRDTLVALDLQGLNPERFHLRKRAVKLDNDVAPMCVIAPAAVTVDWNEGSCESERPNYGFAVALVSAGNKDHTEANCGLHFYWEEEVIRRFLNRIDYVGLVLPEGVQLVRSNVVPPSEAFLAAAAQNNWDAQYLIIRPQVEFLRAN